LRREEDEVVVWFGRREEDEVRRSQSDGADWFMYHA
jgi:hypothetical protein